MKTKNILIATLLLLFSFAIVGCSDSEDENNGREPDPEPKELTKLEKLAKEYGIDVTNKTMMQYAETQNEDEICFLWREGTDQAFNLCFGWYEKTSKAEIEASFVPLGVRNFVPEGKTGVKDYGINDAYRNGKSFFLMIYGYNAKMVEGATEKPKMLTSEVSIRSESGSNNTFSYEYEYIKFFPWNDGVMVEATDKNFWVFTDRGSTSSYSDHAPKASYEPIRSNEYIDFEAKDNKSVMTYKHLDYADETWAITPLQDLPDGITIDKVVLQKKKLYFWTYIIDYTLADKTKKTCTLDVELLRGEFVLEVK